MSCLRPITKVLLPWAGALGAGAEGEAESSAMAGLANMAQAAAATTPAVSARRNRR